MLGTVVHDAQGPTPDSKFDHTSIIATMNKLYKFKNPLNKRDAWAGAPARLRCSLLPHFERCEQQARLRRCWSSGRSRARTARPSCLTRQSCANFQWTVRSAAFCSATPQRPLRDVCAGSRPVSELQRSWMQLASVFLGQK